MSNKSGQILLSVIIMMSILFIFSAGLFSYIMNGRIVSNNTYRSIKALQYAEAGIDRSVWCLNNEDICGINYNGETQSIGDGQFITVVGGLGGNFVVTSTGTADGTEKIIKANITQQTTTIDASFFYGVQVGSGGLKLEENSYIDGNVYSNGSIDSNNNAYVTGDVYVAGSTEIVSDQEQTIQSSDFNFGNSDERTDIAQSFKPSETEVINYVSLYIKKNGNATDATVRIAANDGGKPAIDELTHGTLQASQVTSTYGWVDVSFVSTPELIKNNIYWIVIDVNQAVSNKYYIIGKADNSGYGNGVGLYSEDWSAGSWSNADGDFTFKTWMGAGAIDTYINNLIVGDKTHTCNNPHYLTHHGDAYAHTITNSYIECDAFFDTDPDDIAGTTIKRTKHSGSIDPAPESMPISEGQIADWKAEAEAGGPPYVGNYTSGSTEYLGPLKIIGNLTVPGSSHLILRGTLYVTGDIYVNNGATVSLDPGYVGTSDVVLNDGIMDIENGSLFTGSGNEGSFTLMLTTNNSLSEDTPAINIANNTDGVIFYAAHGLINIVNNANLKEATGYRLRLAQNAFITYEQGLANAKFANGPGGIWATESSTWVEVK